MKLSRLWVLVFSAFIVFACSADKSSDMSLQPVGDDSSSIETSSSYSSADEKSSSSVNSSSSVKEKSSSSRKDGSSSSLEEKSSSLQDASSSSTAKSSESSGESSSSGKSSSSIVLATPCKTDSTDTCEYGSVKDDRDGQTYKTVKIGSQWWMAENLNYAYLQPTASEDSSSFCYNNLPENCEKYGRLYLWSAMMDSAGVFPENTKTKGCGKGVECKVSETVRGVCPKGWHVPDSSEWLTLRDAMDEFSISDWSKKLKSTSGWSDENGTDEYGFSALPGGFASFVDGYGSYYEYEGQYGRFWSTYEMGDCCAVFLNVFTLAMLDVLPKFYANSIRCVKD